jgi:oligopeptidase A
MKGTQIMGQNPLLYKTGLPPFDQIKAEHVVPAVTEVLADANKKFEQLEASLSSASSPTWNSLMQPLDAIDHDVFRVWSPIGHLMGVMNSDELRKAYETMQPEIVKFGLRTSQSRKIYEALVKIQSSADWKTLNKPRQRIIERNILSMKLSGVGLDGTAKERYNQIAQELAALKTKFSNNSLDSTKSWSMILTSREEMDGLPEHVFALASQERNRASKSKDSTPEKGPWRFTQDAPSYLPFMEFSKRRELREKMYRARIAIASSGEHDNSPIIEQILKLKHEQSKLLGFNTFAEQSLAMKMAGNVASVDKLLDELLTASWEAGKKEHAELEAYATSKGFKEKLLEWDIPYYAERLKEEKYQYSEDELRPYFPIPKVLEGMFALVRKIFAIRVEAAPTQAPVWHPDVLFFKVFDENTNRQIAGFYLDPFARPGLKRSGAWMDDCMNRRRIGNEIDLPIAHLVCNGTPPVGGKPGLMGFDEVHTLFHEFGHGLQHMLTTIDDAGASGINGVEWDAVELASQFMENWLYHAPVLRSISGHVDTNAPLPDEYVQKILAARNYRSASIMLRQLHLGLTDMELHHKFKVGGSETPHDVFNRIAKRTSILPPRPENRFLCAFGHIFAGGYSAGYYSYKWAEVLSADAFAAFEEVGLDKEQALRETGLRYRQTVLSLGGGEHPMDVFKKFRGREPSTKALLRHSGLIAN